MSIGTEDQINATTQLQGSRLLYLTPDGDQAVGINSYLDPSSNAIVGLILLQDLLDPPNQLRTTINNTGIEQNDASGNITIDVSWDNLKNLKLATPALRLPATSNIFVVNDTYEANDNNLAKTITATLSAVSATDPTLALEDLISGEKATLTQDTLTYLDASGGTPVSAPLANIIRNSSNRHFYDEMWNEANADNGLLGFRLEGSGTGSASAVEAEADHYGIVKLATASSNTNATWLMRMSLLWSNIDYIECVFRCWNTGTSTNTTVSVGLFNDVDNLISSSVLLQYSTNSLPTNVWSMEINNVLIGSFTGTLATQNVGVWLKLRITNTDDTGSFDATLTRLDTNVSETISGTGVPTATQCFVGGGISCVSGSVSKNMDFDSWEVQLK
jgi:hypothetical protein